jgi:UDP:flavonoid glycosyltransferase YjiC (YdhE family)
MRIVIIAPGSRGDVQSYIALGKGLKNSGNTVRFVTHQNFEALVNSYGLEFWPVEGDVQDIVQNKDMRQRAAGLGSKIQAEDGVARAVEIIQQIDKRKAALAGSG